ncbi:MAG: FtsX-like permease family protein [Bacteroidia bacterium]|nr:FtsX-like permease family protein [Bacteroidia bacterium]
MNTFSVIAMLIACLGLLGLITLVVEVRTKEVGIRKTLGASVQQITRLLAKDFAVLLFVAALVASPVAWWLMRQWLEGFTYRVSPSIQLTAFAIALSASVALVTIAFQVIRASRSNPVDALRTE